MHSLSTSTTPPQSMGRIPLVVLPLDMIEEIFSYINRPSDYLHLALTAKAVNKLVVPDYLYQRIQADPLERSCWKLFSGACAGGVVRSIGVVDRTIIDQGVHGSYELTIPKPEEDFDKEFEAGHARNTIDINYICNILRTSCGLRQFCWKANCTRDLFDFLQPVFESLKQHSGTLKELQIVNIFQFQLSQDFFETCLPLWHLENLTSVFLHIAYDPRIYQITGPRTYTRESHPHEFMDMLLYRCPELQKLHIHYQGRERLHIRRLLEEGHWTGLRELGFGGNVALYAFNDSNEMKRTLLNDFLRRHSNLESLLFRGNEMVHSGSITGDILPKLNALFTYSTYYPILDGIADNIVSHLSTLCLSGNLLRIGMLPRIPSLKYFHCMLHGETATSIAKCFPSYFPNMEVLSLRISALEDVNDFTQLTSCLLEVPKLSRLWLALGNSCQTAELDEDDAFLSKNYIIRHFTEHHKHKPIFKNITRLLYPYPGTNIQERLTVTWYKDGSYRCCHHDSRSPGVTPPSPPEFNGFFRGLTETPLG